MTFLLAELADFAVYIRVRRRGRAVAVVTSNIVSGMLDSVVFLSIAFGATPALHGAPTMTVGRLLASLLTFGVLIVVGWSASRHHDELPNVLRHDAARAGPG
ncbi:MAG: VUT family protein [Cellulomonas sp.]|nr:VUT family protein [Cellulomonas sp.]